MWLQILVVTLNKSHKIFITKKSHGIKLKQQSYEGVTCINISFNLCDMIIDD
jgi:hypothetical protein